MNAGRLVNAYHVQLESPLAHTHVIAVGTVPSLAEALQPAHIWGLEEIQSAGGTVAFQASDLPSDEFATVTRANCHFCGLPRLHVEPPTIEQALPEGLIGIEDRRVPRPAATFGNSRLTFDDGGRITGVS